MIAETTAWTSSPAFDRLRGARVSHLAALSGEIKVYARRASTLEDKIALAEIEHELGEIRRRWAQAGLIDKAT